MDSPKQVDVAVAGGGIVGSALAGALAGVGLKTALIDPYPDAPPNADARPLALAAGSRNILQQAGIWPSLAGSASPITGIHVSHKGRFGAARLDAGEHCVSAFGYVTTTANIHAAVSDWLRARACLIRVSAAVTEISQSDSRVDVYLDQARRNVLSARLVVAADGTKSSLRGWASVGMQSHDYRQVAITANVWPEKPAPGWAFERFTPGGPIALLPMSDRHYGLVWTVPAGLEKELAVVDDETFLARLEVVFGLRLGRFVKVTARGAFPLHLTQAKETTAYRTAIIGNAAQTLHPVAGQGLNLGLRDMAVLAELVADAFRQGADPGAASLLAAFARDRGVDRRRTVILTDGLVKLFGTDFLPVALARGAGLVALNNLHPLRDLFVRQSMGLSGGQPRLARGLPL